MLESMVVVTEVLRKNEVIIDEYQVSLAPLRIFLLHRGACYVLSSLECSNTSFRAQLEVRSVYFTPAYTLRDLAFVTFKSLVWQTDR